MLEKYSGKQVSKAGEKLINDEIYADEVALNAAFDVLSYWRFSHEIALENALMVLRTTAMEKDKEVIFAKRLKRYVSIVRKLKRFPDMKLKNMQDIGGCRAIVANPKKLEQVVRMLRRRPEFKNKTGTVRFKDYFNKPKDDGYRGYHLIGNFDSGPGLTRNIELQIRTKLQHYWATTLEIVDLFTGQALKSNQGDKDWKVFFSGVSEQFALMDDIPLFNILVPQLKYKAYQNKVFTTNNLIDERIEKCKSVQKSAEKLNVIKVLEAFSNSLKIVDGQIEQTAIDGYALIEIRIEIKNATVTIALFKKDENEDAEKKYVTAEKNAAGNKNLVVALVSTTAVGGIKQAYPNYFADSTRFLEHLIFITHLPLEKKRRSLLSTLFGN